MNLDPGEVSEREFAEPNEGPVYDPGPDRERTRSLLAVGVFLLLVAAVLGVLIPVVTGLREWEQVEGVASAVLPAVLGVSGTVLAFYFATGKAHQ